MRIGIELTHRCNLDHPMCDHRVRSSDYELAWADFEWFLANLGECDGVVLTGGEPLVHPRFTDIAGALLDAGYAVQVKTNGIALPLVPDELVDRLDIILQHYPGENDAVVRRYGKRVTVRGFHDWWDPNRDPDLDEATARRVHRWCNIQSGGLRVYGRRLYSCCLAEAVERHWGTEPAHVPFDEDWREWGRIPGWRACQHCFRAIDWMGQKYELTDWRGRDVSRDG